jgi:ABC-type multidrug transport system fused ATPase/permease subunit
LQVENLIEKKLVFLREIDYIIRNLKVKVTLLSILPKYLVEYFLIIIVIVNLSILRNYSSGFTLNASSLAGFAFAIKKILEVYQSFYSNYINMISERTFVDTLYKQIIFDGNNKKPPIIENKEKEFIKKEKINVINVVEFRNNKKKNAYKKSLLNIRDLLVYNNSGEASFLRNLDINEGDQIIIEGPSGCGKSTLLKSLLGVYKDLKGGIYQDKKNILTDKNQLIKWHKSVCYVPQFTEIKFSSLKEIFNVEEFNDKVQLINTILDNVGLSYLKSNLSNDNDKYRTFSGGELQRLSIARALFSCKNIFFLDESFSALDANNEKSIRNYLVSSISNITIVEIAHKAKNKDFYNKVVDFY